jgi:clan AA aspartic protease (TIGR02281 family)
MRGFAQIALAFSLLLATPAAADIYQWRDASGNLHFTDRADRIPPERSGAVEKREFETQAIRVYHARSTSRARTPDPVHVARTRRSYEAVIPFDREGNLMKVHVRLNEDVVAPFYVDTAATHLSITPQVADQLGLDHRSNPVMEVVGTAAGKTRVPVVRIASVQLGEAQVTNLRAHVNGNLEVGLLGASFLNHFDYSVDSARGVLELRAAGR